MKFEEVEKGSTYLVQEDVKATSGTTCLHSGSLVSVVTLDKYDKELNVAVRDLSTGAYLWGVWWTNASNLKRVGE